MTRTPLNNAYDKKGAFNHVVLSLQRSANAEAVVDALDALLATYGGVGAVSREGLLSHRFLLEVFRELENLSNIFPAIILAVAAFQLKVVATRLVSLQREQIASLKAFGYGNRDVTLHYVELVMIIVVLGSLLGVAAGVWMGLYLSGIFAHFFG